MKSKFKNSISVAICALAIGALTAFSGSDGWTLLSQTDGVEGYVQQIDCQGKNLLSFKLKNTTAEDLTVVYTMEAKQNPTIPPITKTVVLTAKSEQSGSCESNFVLALPDFGNEKEISKRAQITINIKR